MQKILIKKIDEAFRRHLSIFRDQQHFRLQFVDILLAKLAKKLRRITENVNKYYQNQSTSFQIIPLITHLNEYIDQPNLIEQKTHLSV